MRQSYRQLNGTMDSSSRVDSRVENDKTQIVQQLDVDDSDSDWSSLHKFKTSCWSNKWVVAPVVVSTIAFFLALATVFGLAVRWHQMNMEISRLESIVTQLQSGSQVIMESPQAQKQTTPAPLTTPGSTYIHWGKSQCNSGADHIYTGFTVSSHGTSEQWGGGGVNYLCLPPNPDYDKYDMKNDTSAHSWVYSTEFLAYNLGIFDDSVHGHNVPCSLCHVPRAAKFMLPGKNVCPQSWMKEYSGYLMSSYVSDNKNTFECVDGNPDVIGGTKNVTGGSGMYFVSGYCGAYGGLSYCPPYVTARELTCAICTK